MHMLINLSRCLSFYLSRSGISKIQATRDLPANIYPIYPRLGGNLPLEGCRCFWIHAAIEKHLRLIVPNVYNKRQYSYY